MNHIKRIQEKLDTYISEIPVLGYNSSKYDLNLINQNWPNICNLLIQRKILL